MKDFLKEKDALNKEDLLEVEGPQEADRKAGEDYAASAKLGDKNSQRAVDRAGPAAQGLAPEGAQKEEEQVEVPEIEYGGKASEPSLMGIKLAVLSHPNFKNQARILNKKGGPDAFILFYWTVLQHEKFKSGSAISQFRNSVLQRAKPERISAAAEWVAQAAQDEYTPRHIVDFLTGRRDRVDNLWKQDPVQFGAQAEVDLAMAGEYKSWGRVNAQSRGHFPLIDFVKGDSAVSLKMVDPYDGRAVERTKAHMDELAARMPGRQVEKDIDDDGEMDQVFESFNLILDLRIPPDTEKKVKDLVAYGEALGIEVKISPYGTNPLKDMLRPGDRPPLPGEYVERGPHGELIQDARRVTMEHGDEILPPTAAADRVWVRVSPPKPEL